MSCSVLRTVPIPRFISLSIEINSIASNETDGLYVISSELIFASLRILHNDSASSSDETVTVGKNFGNSKFLLVIKN